MMGNLENGIEELLDAEAVRLLGEVLTLYKNKTKVNKSFEQLIRSLLKEEYVYLYLDITYKVRRLFPKNLEEDISGEYALTTRDDYLEQWLTKYEKCCIKDKSKNHKKVSKNIAIKLIEHCNTNDRENDDIIQLLVRNIKEFMPDHNDSVDFKTILLYLQQDILDNGYIISNLSPLRIDKL